MIHYVTRSRAASKQYIAIRSSINITQFRTTSSALCDISCIRRRMERYDSIRRRRFLSTTRATSSDVTAKTTVNTAIHTSCTKATKIGVEIDADKVYKLVASGQIDEALVVFQNIDVVDEVHGKRQARALLDAFLQQHKKEIDSFLLLNSSYTSSGREIEDGQVNNLKRFLKWSNTCHTLLEIVEPALGIRSDRSKKNNNNKLKNNSGIGEEYSTKPKINSTLSLSCEKVLETWSKSLQAAALFRTHTSSSHILQGVLPVGIPQRAEFLLRKMLDHDHIFVSTSSLNHCIAAWGYSLEHHQGSNAERVFEDCVKRKVRHSIGTRRILIRAWCMSQERTAAFVSSGHLRQVLRMLQRNMNRDSREGFLFSDADNSSTLDSSSAATSQQLSMSDEMDGRSNQNFSDSQEPTLVEYHMVLQAWTSSHERTSPMKCHDVIKTMIFFYRKGIIMVKPDEICYRHLLKVLTNRPKQKFDHVINQIFREMKDDMIVPNSDCYTYAIKIRKNGALYVEDELQDDREKHITAAIKFLDDIEAANNRSISTAVIVRTENVNDILEALSVSLKENRLSKALRYLERLESAVVEGNTLLYPTANSYIFTLRVLASYVKIPDRIQKGKTVLEGMIRNIKSLAHENVKQRKEIVRIFDEFILLCSKHQPTSTSDGMAVIGEALSAIESMRGLMGGNNFRPGPSTYTALLEACSVLMDTAGPARDALLTKVFDLCKDDRLVNGDVIMALKEHASTELYHRLVVSKCELLDEMKMVPEVWTVNALGGSIIGVDGRKTIPLSIEGTTTKTMSMKEFHVRRLRDKRNRKLLEGGRSQTLKPHLYRSSFRLYDNEGKSLSQYQHGPTVSVSP